MRPDVMRGIPEEPGYYFGRPTYDDRVWKLYEVTYPYGDQGTRVAELVSDQPTMNPKRTCFKEMWKTHWEWSTRIQPPEEGA